MENDTINFYIWNILKKQLQKYKISNEALYNILNNVKMQLYSIIEIWNNIEFRNAILILASEEAKFYEPKNEIIASMVVIAIRNSLLEGVSSVSYKKYGSNTYLENKSIKQITKEAIIYFASHNLDEISKSIKLEYNFYKEVSSRYKVAMKALTELAKCSEDTLEKEYEKVKFDKPFELEELNLVSSDKKTRKNEESGIDATFNDSLCNFLIDIKKKKSKILVTDSFKMTTRNFEKMLKIIEFILTHDAFFATCNYLITNGYVSRRKTIIKAAHTDLEFLEKIKDLKEISNKYKSFLEKYR